jgi:hypothetical protein
MGRYAKELVTIMYGSNAPDLGAASDGMQFFYYNLYLLHYLMCCRYFHLGCCKEVS